MAPKGRKVRRQIYDYIKNLGRQNEIYSCKIRLTTANFEPCIPPIAAWWDGWWEQMLHSTKELFMHVLRKSSVNYEKLCTILCNVEAMLNNCLLTYFGWYFWSYTLIPSMLLQDLKHTGITELDGIDWDKLLISSICIKNYKSSFVADFVKNTYGS